MITNFKIFENISVPYKVGDYALIKMQWRGIMYDNLLCKIISNESPYRTPGVDIKVKILNNDNFKYDYIIQKDYLICWSENKEELETLIDAKKYNL